MDTETELEDVAQRERALEEAWGEAGEEGEEGAAEEPGPAKPREKPAGAETGQGEDPAGEGTPSAAQEEQSRRADTAPGPEAGRLWQPGERLRHIQRQERERRRELERFLETFPGVRGRDVPREVWERVAAGEKLTSAYAMYQNRTLSAQLAAERQYRQNQLRTTGSLADPSGGERGDDIDRWWREDE